MKLLNHMTYYEMLGVEPSATLFEIKQAYAEARSLYNEEAAVTYGMFSEPQREEILNRLKTALDTLMDETRRSAYDRQLVAAGKMDPASSSDRQPKKPVPLFETSTVVEDTLDERIAERAASPDAVNMSKALHGRDRISGGDLRAYRRLLGVRTEDVYAATRISSSITRALESDAYEQLPSPLYLKNFLKAYASLLGLDPEHTMHAYLKNAGMEA